MSRDSDRQNERHAGWACIGSPTLWAGYLKTLDLVQSRMMTGSKCQLFPPPSVKLSR
jgi:hypothetical protein